MNSNYLNPTEETSIMPENISTRDTAFILMLTREKVIQRVQGKYIFDMKSKQLEIGQLNQKLMKKSSTVQEFSSTKDAASFIGVDPSFLTKRQGKAFKQGTHFFKPKGESIIRWKLSALTDWLTGKQNNSNNADSKLENLLKRR